MNSKTSLLITIFILFCLLSLYSYGTAMMDYFLVYPSRFIVNEEDFIKYHQLLESAILPISVLPFLIIIILNTWLLFRRPEYVSKSLLWISFIFLILDLLSTVLLQAPWNLELSKGKDVALMQKITDTNWLRVFLETGQAILVFIMLRRYIIKLVEINQ